MRGNLHRYRVSPSRKKNRMLQGTFLPSYSPVLKNAGYGLLLTLAVECRMNKFIKELWPFYLSDVIMWNVTKICIVIWNVLSFLNLNRKRNRKRALSAGIWSQFFFGIILLFDWWWAEGFSNPTLPSKCDEDSADNIRRCWNEPWPESKVCYLTISW